MNPIKTFGKFLDQPILVSKLDKAMPKIITTCVGAKVLYDCFETSKKNKTASTEEKKANNKELFKKSVVTTFAFASALSAASIAGFVTKRKPIEKLDKVVEQVSNTASEILSSEKFDDETVNILNKSKKKVLSLKEVKTLSGKLSKVKNGNNMFNKLIPDPENITSKEIFSQIGYLSLYGAIPVAGGVAGGVAADVLTKDDYKKNLPDKVSEGVYQYLANIFMCNVGAGAALALLEKNNITSKAARAVGMTAGIILTGVIGGSKVANLISEKVISPLISPNKKPTERKPEALDMFMHSDDIATVSVLSGLKWIEPALPILYGVSGYRAGTGYRN